MDSIKTIDQQVQQQAQKVQEGPLDCKDQNSNEAASSHAIVKPLNKDKMANREN